MTGTLYLCATPIGNLEDITFRVLRTLKEVDLIAAEDTRNSIKLLNHFDIHTPMESYHEFNKMDKGEELANRLEAGQNIALITDAGMPGISDPGEELVRISRDRGITVTAVPGPTAFATAAVISGRPCRRLAFEAFLPKDKKEHERVMAELRQETRTMLIYEAPHHLKKTLKELCQEIGPDRKITVTRELTKKFEEGLEMTLSEAVAYYETREPRGEYVLVLEGKSKEIQEEEYRSQFENLSLEEHMALYTDQGMDRKEAMKAVARDRGVSKRDIYNELLK